MKIKTQQNDTTSGLKQILVLDVNPFFIIFCVAVLIIVNLK